MLNQSNARQESQSQAAPHQSSMTWTQTLLNHAKRFPSTCEMISITPRTNTINDATPNNISFVFKVEGFDGDYRVDDIFQSEYKYFTKIIGIKIE